MTTLTGSWSPEEDLRLTELWPVVEYTVTDIAADLRRTRNAVLHRAAILNLDLKPRAPQAAGSVWSPEVVEKLLTRWKAGVPASVIAAELRVTRNSVIGKIHRLGAGRTSPSSPRNIAAKPPRQRKLRQNNGTPRKVALRPVTPKAKADEVEMPTGDAWEALPGTTPRPWIERPFNACTWPIEVNGETYACCAPVKKRGWCAKHYARGTVKPQKKKGGLRVIAGGKVGFERRYSVQSRAA